MAHAMKGIIVMWSGVVADIPFGWKLCDGTNGTPDLSERFIRAVGGGIPPHQVSGTAYHDHANSHGTHAHDLPAGADVAAGTDFAHHSSSTLVEDRTAIGYHYPPYHSLCFIMHI